MTSLGVAAAGGDDEALSALVRTYHARVYRFGTRVCRDGFDADDAVQEAFVKLSRRPEVARDAGVLSWLFAVVMNACRKMLAPFARERKTLGAQVDDLDATEDTTRLDPEAALARFELVSAVHAAIARLPPLAREVIVLRDLEGLSGDETCRAIGVDIATMKTRLHRARAALRDDLSRTIDREARPATFARDASAPAPRAAKEDT